MRISVIIFFLFSFSALYGQKDDFKRARQFFFEKKYQTASDLLKKVISEKPDHAVAASLLGDSYLFQGKYELAIQYYRRAVELTEKPAKEKYRIGQAYIGLEKGKEAYRSFKEAVEIDPWLKQAYFQMGYVQLVFFRNKDSVISHWQKFIEIAPDDVQYEKIKRILKMLRNPDFKLPPAGSDVSLEESLRLGGKVIEVEDVELKDKQAGHEKTRINNQTEGLIEDEGI